MTDADESPFEVRGTAGVGGPPGRRVPTGESQSHFYKKQEGNLEIEIYAVEKKESVILWIKDNGMGIKKGEITRVFEKGFTGTNGRILGRKSTGIGLYLCKKLCQKLGVAIELNSIQEEGTEVRIVFPKNSYTNL